MGTIPKTLDELELTEKTVFIQGNTKDNAIAVCSGRSKLIVRYDGNRDKTYELYGLPNDPNELTNLSEENTSVTKQLATALEKAEAAGRTRY